VPSRAKRILDVGCARGRLGHELKLQDPTRYVVGVEQDPDAAKAAGERLDDVFVLDVQVDTPPIEPGSLDCLLLGDVLEHLVDPEEVLRRYRGLLRDDGLVLVSVPNIQHFSVIKNLLRGDFMYQPSGLLDGTHLRFFTYMSFAS
jgi:2-polyprenyl-3-methyl-5-hydroxy-6-metoxy-1,4-benzoquinol methylase